MTKRILIIVSIFLIGIAGGVFASQVLLPYFLEDSLLGIDSVNLARIASGPVYITENKEITVQENIALQESALKVKDAIVGIKTTYNGKTIYGSGVILTVDGLMVSFSDIVPRGGDFVFYANGKAAGYKILKRNSENNLILLKLDSEKLEPTGFADLEQIKMGERVFLAGTEFNDDNGRLDLINEGIVRTIEKDIISTNIFEEPSLLGSSLFNIKGELLGLNRINKNGRVETVPISIIKEFAGF